jgi:hypothetical protein
MANTFELIASSTVGAGGAATIDFTSIPSTYTDLLLYVSGRGANAAQYNYSYLRINGSSSSYSGKSLVGSGSSAASYNEGTTDIRIDTPGASNTTSTFSNHLVYIPNYAGSSNKSISVDASYESNSTNNQLWFIAELWSNTAAINQLTLTATSSTFVQYSTAYLYGIKNS